MGGRLTKEQGAWRITLQGNGADYRAWNPEDWLTGRIEKALRERGKGGDE